MFEGKFKLKILIMIYGILNILNVTFRRLENSHIDRTTKDITRFLALETKLYQFGIQQNGNIKK